MYWSSVAFSRSFFSTPAIGIYYLCDIRSLVSIELVWIFALLSLGSWFGAETGYVSGWGAYYLGMNYPMRFVLFGIVLLAASTILPIPGKNLVSLEPSPYYHRIFRCIFLCDDDAVRVSV